MKPTNNKVPLWGIRGLLGGFRGLLALATIALMLAACREYGNKVEMNDEQFMQRAIELSVENIKNGGGPFGAVIVKDGKIVAEGTNRVTADNDPTAHAEISAIRKAAKKLKTFDLSGCVIYTSCEPCPMCLSAIYWARLDKIYFGNTKDDAKDIGFDDSFIYDELEPADRKITMECLLPEEAILAFVDWLSKEDKIRY
jgi:tRNA(Arg) A34 adenosine deaminase TadA